LAYHTNHESDVGSYEGEIVEFVIEHLRRGWYNTKKIVKKTVLEEGPKYGRFTL